jgi:two-component system cell cycle sensor histidine kinase/response regulator CckA
LTVILANAELALADTAPGDAQRSALVEIRDAASRGAALTRDLLAFGRRQSLQPVTLDLDEVVARSVATVGSVLGRGIMVEATRPGEGKRIHADPTVLQQALLNLVLNARDAMPEGGRLSIRTAVVEVDAAHAERLGLGGAGRHVTLEVIDTGVGMDPATLSRVFEPFFTTKPEGTGLGLATVYGIVRQSGGAIQAESMAGAGTTFRIYFPEAAETPLVEVT